MLRIMVVTSCLLASVTAHADDSVLQLSRDASFTPGMLRSAGTDGGIVTVASGWNGADKQTTLDLLGEAHLFGPVRAIVQIASELGTSYKPGAGLGVQWLDEAKHGVSSTAYVLFKTEGFTEPEGEIEATLSFGRHVGAAHIGLGVTYGQDPDAHERDGELALGIQTEVMHALFAGFVGRARDALGSVGDKNGVVRDGFGGASSTYAIGRVAVTAMVGVAGVKIRDTATAVGPAATLAVGTVF